VGGEHQINFLPNLISSFLYGKLVIPNLITEVSGLWTYIEWIRIHWNRTQVSGEHTINHWHWTFFRAFFRVSDSVSLSKPQCSRILLIRPDFRFSKRVWPQNSALHNPCLEGGVCNAGSSLNPLLSTGRRFATSKDHVWIAAEQFVRFYKNKFDERLCQLDSTEYARLFPKPDPATATAAVSRSRDGGGH